MLESAAVAVLVETKKEAREQSKITMYKRGDVAGVLRQFQCSGTSEKKIHFFFDSLTLFRRDAPFGHGTRFAPSHENRDHHGQSFK